ncbi:hypothetical protein CVT26_001644 [Gymnopilus dilepis]|uniref:Uncharacterized protein n=1 Tax=Gymnopilus dilepis TaxID=231916 RepID=A0A409VU07_9AGAR|nr:hypothetical protein CVT26_001644 [Gymnopilus dilepis]
MYTLNASKVIEPKFAFRSLSVDEKANSGIITQIHMEEIKVSGLSPENGRLQSMLNVFLLRSLRVEDEVYNDMRVSKINSIIEVQINLFEFCTQLSEEHEHSRTTLQIA